MRRSLVLLISIIAMIASPVSSQAQSSGAESETFVSAFLAFRKAEDVERSGNLKEAMRGYREAAELLKSVQQKWPSWQPAIVEFRLKRTQEAITNLQTQMAKKGIKDPTATADNTSGLPDNILSPEDVLPPIPDGNSPASAQKPPKAKPVNTSGDPIAQIQEQIKTLSSQLQETNEKLREEQQKNAELTKDLLESQEARTKAESTLKKAQDLADLYQKNVLDLKTSSERNSTRASEMEIAMESANKKLIAAQAEAAAAEERASQLAERAKAMAVKVAEAGEMPGQIKNLQAKLDAEQKAKAEQAEQFSKEKQTLTETITKITGERDTAMEEISKLKQANKEADKLVQENTNLLKKLGDAEKQILAFKTDAPKKDEEIAALKKQVTDIQKELGATQEKNTTMESELAKLQAKVTDYTKELQQAKTDKTTSLEERKKMEEENALLNGIVMRVMKEDANRAVRRKIIQKELDRLQVNSEVLQSQLNLHTQSVVKLTSAERRLFKNPVLEVQDLNTLIAVKSEASEPPPAQPPANPDQPGDSSPAPEVKNPPGDETLPPLPADPAKPEMPTPGDSLQITKVDNPPTQPPATGTPENPAQPPAATPGNPTSTNSPEVVTGTPAPANLPEAVKPIADQAKQAFEREKFPEAIKLYEKALIQAPNNLYLLSNLGVVQFRAGQLKAAEATFKKAIAIAPEDAFSHCTLGIVQYSQQKYDEAVNSLTKSLAINMKNPTAHNYLGITAAQKGWMEAAQKELDTALQLDPNYADAWFNLAVIHATKQPPNKEEARKAYKKAIELGAEPDPSMEQMIK